MCRFARSCSGMHLSASTLPEARCRASRTTPDVPSPSQSRRSSESSVSWANSRFDCGDACPPCSFSRSWKEPVGETSVRNEEPSNLNDCSSSRREVGSDNARLAGRCRRSGMIMLLPGFGGFTKSPTRVAHY
eukprot:7282510-Prymnesium_polylepis.2